MIPPARFLRLAALALLVIWTLGAGVARFAVAGVAILWGLGACILACIAVLAPRLATAMDGRLQLLMNRFHLRMNP